MSIILAVDPGPEQSAWVLYDTQTGQPYSFGLERNAQVRQRMMDFSSDVLVLEMIASYGMPVGAEVFETCRWIGRLEEMWRRTHSGSVETIYRQQVKLHLCGQARAKDSNIRQALIDRFGPGREKAIGTKASPGPLHGFKADLWAALAVAVTWADQNSPSEAVEGLPRRFSGDLGV